MILYPLDERTESPALAELRLVDRYLPDFPPDAVLFDNYSIGYRLTEYLSARATGASAHSGTRSTSPASASA
ncbi:hypothetical protein ACFXJ8_35930 [Nonomuraea sp. NPDC059194]|uniref:hypothetical protein n=1 Tax=Nonomuraea sp. NPDC059194 TaxID=3346764 RepID=UPI0036A4585C